MTPRDRLIEAAAESLFQLAYLPSTYWRPEWDDVDGGAKDYNRAKAGQVLDALTASPEIAGVLARWAAEQAGLGDPVEMRREINTVLRAWESTAYVGGMSERQAYKMMTDALGRFRDEDPKGVAGEDRVSE